MNLTISPITLVNQLACDLEKRCAEMNEALGYPIQLDDKIPLETWWDLDSTSVPNMWWSLRALNDEKEGWRIGVLGAVRAIRRVPEFPKYSEQYEPLLQEIEEAFADSAPDAKTTCEIQDKMWPIPKSYPALERIIDSLGRALNPPYPYLYVCLIARSCIEEHISSTNNEENPLVKKEYQLQDIDLRELAGIKP